MSTQTQSPPRLAALLLTALLLLLAFRLTASETLRDSISQKSQTLALQLHPSPDSAGQVPFVGPTYTATYATITLMLAAAAAWLAWRAGALSNTRLLQLALIALILTLLLTSMAQASNRFGALVGAVDIAVSLLAAWTLTLLCHDALLGQGARRVVIAAVIAILALGVGKALLQYFVEYPDLAELVKEHKEDILRAQGIVNDPAQEKMFLARLNSGEVTGYSAFSNVFASEMAGMAALLSALLVAAGRLLKQNSEAALTENRNKPRGGGKKDRVLEYKSKHTPGPRGEVPLPVVAYIGVAVVLALALLALNFTDSKGGVAAAALAAGLLMLGGLFPHRVKTWRKMLLAAAVAAAVVLPIAVISYGLVRHGLPSKSLLFRWQYWTATAPMIQQHPLWGLGLNNFGDYYMQYKNPASPEDVKDPHSFFVRLAAEAGVPATMALAGLMVWLLAGAFRAVVPSEPIPPRTNGFVQSIILAGVAAIVWIPLHLLAEPATTYHVMLSTMFACAAWGVFVAVLYLLENLPNAAMRYMALAATIAALGMLLYDQINMALVTGPAAMLFWMLLAVGDNAPEKTSAASRKPLLGIPALMATAALVSLCLLVIPLANETFSWDTTPFEFQYIRHISDYQEAAKHPETTPAQRAEMLNRAAADLDAALARWPNGGELLMQRILINRERHLPTADDIRRIFDIDRANAKSRLDLAIPDSDLPVSERIAALRRALELDQALPTGETKRLNQDQLKSVHDTLARLQSTPASVPATRAEKAP